MMSKIRKTLLAIAGGTMAILGISMAGGTVAAADAAPQTVRAGNIEMTVNGHLTPRALPRRGMAPAVLNVSGHLREIRGEHPQVLAFMDLHFDRAGMIFTRGLPICPPARIENTRPDQARQACGRALVGRGTANAQVEFPDQAPFQAPANDLMIFNAPGGNNLVIHAYAFTPLPTTFVVPVRIVNSPHPLFRVRSIVRLPEIAGGWGSMMTSADTGRPAFQARLGRSWNFRGQRRHLIYAGCPRGAHRAHGMFQFEGGPRLIANIVQRCIPRR